MTKKHFIWAADQVRHLYEVGVVTQADITKEAYVDLFRHFGERFDEARFRAACRVK